MADLGFQLRTENDKVRVTLRNLGLEMDALLVPKSRAVDYQLRVTETLNVTGPAMVNVMLSFPRAAREKGWWIQSTPHEGIRVVEQLLSKISHDDADQNAHVMGSTTVVVEPGATLDVDTLAGAWAVGAPTEKQIALCAEGAKVAARASRAIADSDPAMT